MSGRKVIALSGGIGGAKLALGLKRVLPVGALTLIANTGDDFKHMGLHVSPDIDTLIYTLSGLSNTTLGWGREDETWSFMDAMAALKGDTWFQLGDRDLAMHVLRTHRLGQGQSLTAITAHMCDALSVGARIMPMSDQPVRTRIQSREGWIDFQDYFVRQRAQPVVQALAFEGADSARPAEGLLEALQAADLEAIVICPSNPLISVEPILAVPGITEAIKQSAAPVIAVSPIIDGKAVKGPTTKMLQELGFEATAATVLKRYGGLLDAYIADPRDIPSLEAAGSDALLVADRVLMNDMEDRKRLARTVLDVAAGLSKAD